MSIVDMFTVAGVTTGILGAVCGFSWFVIKLSQKPMHIQIETLITSQANRDAQLTTVNEKLATILLELTKHVAKEEAHGG